MSSPPLPKILLPDPEPAVPTPGPVLTPVGGDCTTCRFSRPDSKLFQRGGPIRRRCHGTTPSPQGMMTQGPNRQPVLLENDGRFPIVGAGPEWWCRHWTPVKPS